MSKKISLLCIMLLLLTACQTPPPEVPDPANAIYYWKSELKLEQEECNFLSSHNIKKVYLHLFDVVRRNGNLQPQTTLIFTDTFPTDVKVIPIVFMNHDILKDTTGVSQLPQLIAQRVKQMMVQNYLPAPEEMQIDFDWTKRNSERYFAFLEQLKKALQTQGMQQLSATIRLHQLSMPAPPVDYGALMAYNVGQLQNPDEECSILTTRAVQPYLKHLASYPLPLCAALPAYSWNILFHDRSFQCILRGVEVADTSKFIRLDPTHYQALCYQIIPPNTVTQYSEGRVFPGDIVRHEEVSAKTLQEVHHLLEKHRAGITRQVILYHLDNNQLKTYNHNEIEGLFSKR